MENIALFESVSHLSGWPPQFPLVSPEFSIRSQSHDAPSRASGTAQNTTHLVASSSQMETPTRKTDWKTGGMSSPATNMGIIPTCFYMCLPTLTFFFPYNKITQDRNYREGQHLSLSVIQKTSGNWEDMFEIRKHQPEICHCLHVHLSFPQACWWLQPMFGEFISTK